MTGIILLNNWNFFQANGIEDGNKKKDNQMARHNSEYCDCGTLLNNMLLDRLVYGLNYSQIQQKLLSERASLTL